MKKDDKYINREHGYIVTVTEEKFSQVYYTIYGNEQVLHINEKKFKENFKRIY